MLSCYKYDILQYIDARTFHVPGPDVPWYGPSTHNYYWHFVGLVALSSNSSTNTRRSSGATNNHTNLYCVFLILDVLLPPTVSTGGSITIEWGVWAGTIKCRPSIHPYRLYTFYHILLLCLMSPLLFSDACKLLQKIFVQVTCVWSDLERGPRCAVHHMARDFVCLRKSLWIMFFCFHNMFVPDTFLFVHFLHVQSLPISDQYCFSQTRWLRFRWIESLKISSPTNSASSSSCRSFTWSKSKAKATCSSKAIRAM